MGMNVLESYWRMNGSQDPGLPDVPAPEDMLVFGLCGAVTIHCVQVEGFCLCCDKGCT